MYEIEHKYLVDTSKQYHYDLETMMEVSTKKEIIQGYVIDDSKQGVLRVRIINDNEAYLTFKRSTKERGKNIEVEVQISVEEAKLLLDGCERKITKVRHEIPYADHLWEVDVFTGKLEGLIVAEIEIDSVDTTYIKPAWLGIDVTDDKRFSNYALALVDFKDLNI
jgi:adenylate cyclase